MNVFVFMVNDYCKRRVNFDYRKAATFAFLLLDNELITFPKVVKDKFIFLSS